MLILGDVHGNLEKTKAFLAYKFEEAHCFVGDFVDSFSATDEEIYETLKTCIESGAILLIGNHDLHYFSDPPFTCSGHRHYMQKGLNEIFEAFIAENRFKPAIVTEGFLVTHGGLSQGLGNSMRAGKDVNVILGKIEDEWKAYLETRFLRKLSQPRTPRKIFNIDFSRGGMDSFAGIFWADYRSTRLYGIPQIFGHSKTPKHDIIDVGNKNMHHFAIGCDNDRRLCLNTKTMEAETFE